MGIYRKSVKYEDHDFLEGKWYSIAASYDHLESTMKLFLGGKEVSTYTIDSPGEASKAISYENDNTAAKEYFRINGADSRLGTFIG
jgi:hypothetical protein